jgi:hypothetical protein
LKAIIQINRLFRNRIPSSKSFSPGTGRRRPQAKAVR